ncbi:HDIG domain-containing protein [Enterococcus asini]|uniref:HD family phosphohydrolase n=1 Tax=Enterococcus asini TaxID=57732 RepID=UPI00288F8B24|nr:HDIG domain-containing metalloprotein [Enterococcus asini]MDT2784597.1 HDIG domain-containing protein [Enterococcus asini]
MIIQPLSKIRAKLGRYYTPLLFILFFLGVFGIVYPSVRQQKVDYQEGQVVNENIRANKTVENTAATEQKRKLAAEAVTPEYTFQEDIATTQFDRVKRLFDLVTTVNSDLKKEYEEKKKADDETLAAPSVEEHVAALKKKFEKLDVDDVNFYQQFSNDFYQNLFSLSATDLTNTRNRALSLLGDIMEQHIRESNLADVKDDGIKQVEQMAIGDTAKSVITDLVNTGIVVNEFLNEKITEEKRQTARSAVQPVMIYQGEIIVREGSQIDASAIEKLRLLGLTSQNGSIFPVLAMAIAVLLQIMVLLYFGQQLSTRDKRQEFYTFYSFAMFLSVAMMKFFQLFQSEQIQYIPLFFPAAFVPLVLNLFMNRRSGILSALFQVVAAIFVYYDSIGTNLLTTILVTYLFAGLMGTIVKRQRIAYQGFPAVMWLIVFPSLMNLVLVIFQGLSFYEGSTWLTLICGVAGNVLGFLLTMGLHQYIELLVTDDSAIVLNELSNPNHPLLKKLLEEAPGTYHHSMMVANLSANAVADIGGRSLMTRVACYYHDIGKLKHANFFVENLPTGAENPHNFLLPEDSKQIIFGHVTDGAKILEDYKMPRMVVDICYQHHGTTLMKFFYAKAKERNPEVTEADFRYPGPKPQTREAGVVSIADSCEAAVRAMDHPTNDKIQKFVHNLIVDRIIDGQLDDSGLTMKEIRIVEKSLVNGLCSTFHSRIKYPKMKSEAEKMKEEQERSEA